MFSFQNFSSENNNQNYNNKINYNSSNPFKYNGNYKRDDNSYNFYNVYKAYKNTNNPTNSNNYTFNPMNNAGYINRCDLMCNNCDKNNNIYNNFNGINNENLKKLINYYLDTKDQLNSKNCLNSIPEKESYIFRNFKIKTIDQKYVSRFKDFIAKELIPTLINQHKKNLVALNNCLQSFNIEIMDTIPDKNYDNTNGTITEYFKNELEMKGFYDKMIKEDEFMRKKKETRDILDNLERNLNNMYAVQFQNSSLKDRYVPDNKIKIFYGESTIFKEFIKIIDKKLNFSNEFLDAYNINNGNLNLCKIITKNLRSEGNCFNKDKDLNNNSSQPLDKIDKKEFSQIVNSINVLNILMRLFLERLNLNDRLFPLVFKKDITVQLYNIIMLYIVHRLEELNYLNFNYNYREFSGGNFYGLEWCSLLPSDGNLLLNICINYLEDLYQENYESYNSKMFLRFENYNPSTKDIFIYYEESIENNPLYKIISQDEEYYLEIKDGWIQAIIYLIKELQNKKNDEFINMHLSKFYNDLIKS